MRLALIDLGTVELDKNRFPKEIEDNEKTET